MNENPHFEKVQSWDDARALIRFAPWIPEGPHVSTSVALSVHVKDHRGHDLAPGDRSLEAHFDEFVLDQKRHASASRAKSFALETLFGPNPRCVSVRGHEGRSYALGPPPPPHDIDGRSPAIVVWSEVEVVILLASTQLDEADLLAIAATGS